MEKEDILLAVVERARQRGFDDSDLTAFFNKQDTQQGKDFMLKAMAHSPHSLIFRHDFAKSFFGDESILEEYPLSDGSGEYLKIWMPAWQAHLRKMVIDPEPLLYFRKFL
jgi:hypothetical protein